jgi:hypothetical protein
MDIFGSMIISTQKIHPTMSTGNTPLNVFTFSGYFAKYAEAKRAKAYFAISDG